MEWVDTLRGLAIVLVLSLHASLALRRHGLEPWQPAVEFNEFFAPYRMAMLMLLSGLLLGSALRKPPHVYVLRKIGSLMWPYVLWTTIYGVAVNEAGVIHVPLWTGATYLWFLLFLFTYYLAGLALRRVPTAAVVLACFAVSLAAPDGTKYFERYFFLMGFFFLGAWLQQRPAWLQAPVLSAPKLLIPAAALALGLSVASVLGSGINYDARFLVPALAGIALLIAVAKSAPGSGWARGLSFVGRHSVVYFVVHYPVMYAAMALALGLGYRDEPGLIYTAALLTGVLVSSAMVVLRERAPFTEMLYSLPLSQQPRRQTVRPPVSVIDDMAPSSVFSESK
ncbi:acyltransferase [Schlegelella sp. S2-27]|uniref:Acyltransferase n=1 Tax=Caldimonas mangrovi TaxID=2944811 RepID=A0ABT0YU57_9BURK|nr:acyltransferase family protein [Caldimonas mangrovi]MCM5682284.1 acyltransferase [Caldimonas mangrovi]